MTMSKTMQALRLLDMGRSVREAAREVGVSEQAVYTAKKRQEASMSLGKARCPCCNSLVPEHRIDRGVLK